MVLYQDVLDVVVVYSPDSAIGQALDLEVGLGVENGGG